MKIINEMRNEMNEVKGEFRNKIMNEMNDRLNKIENGNDFAK